MGNKALPPEERFWPKVDKNGLVPSGRQDLGPCWIWTAGLDIHGYGKFRVGTRSTGGQGSSVGAHRFAYELLIGEVPEGFEVDHLCHVRKCVNPRHLEAVTPQVNTLRRLPFMSHQTDKDRCPADHPYSGANLYIDSRGRRRCRICIRETNRRYYRKRKTAA